ncbi:MAG: 30S ribosomal protein S9 [Ignavibacteria bacterium]
MVDKIAVGRRKTSVARVVIRPGSGKIVVNGKDINDYFKTKIDTLKATEPLKVVDAEGKYDFLINVKGGGVTGQVGAISLGIARALVLVDPDYRIKLRNLGYLTRDPRMVERKKYGQPKARKRFQFSKR